MPRISHFKWSHDEVRRSLTEYLRQRGTFTDVVTAPADLTMTVTPKLSLKSRWRYWYRVRLQVDIQESTRTIKSYAAEHEVAGSFARWVTASDRDPIEAALQQALDDVMTQIEADRELYEPNAGRPKK
jgi:uncharacterized lipoprotein YajG